MIIGKGVRNKTVLSGDSPFVSYYKIVLRGWVFGETVPSMQYEKIVLRGWVLLVRQSQSRSTFRLEVFFFFLKILRIFQFSLKKILRIFTCLGM